jgi:hypothetical protein
MEAHAGGRLDAVVAHCGPVALSVIAETPALRSRVLAELEQFNARWDDPCALIRVRVHVANEPRALGDGRLLHCSGIRVDTARPGLVATCASGASGIYDSARRQWDLYIVSGSTTGAACDLPAEDCEDNVEDLLELILTTAWREAGWIPLHTGTATRNGCCALLMAPARGGKSTLTAALLHRGWRTLGDDKLLMTLRPDGQAEVRGLTAQFNLDPQAGAWFPELGDLESKPRLSSWTAKRRVSIGAVWGDCFAASAVPTHVVLLRRLAERVPPRIESLGAREVLSALLRQTVIPADPTAARQILTVVAGAARSMQGVRLEIGDDAYRDPSALRALEEVLG